MAAARASGDDRALDGLFERMLPLARGLAFEYRWPHEPVEDLLQVASLALFAALKRFDPRARRRRLPRRQRQLVGLRFLADLALKEISQRAGISEVHVGGLLRQAMARAEVVVAE